MFTSRKCFVLLVLLFIIGCAPPLPEPPARSASDPVQSPAPQVLPTETAVPNLEATIEETNVDDTAVSDETIAATSEATYMPLVTSTTDCPTDTFISVQPHPANSSYPDPVLEVTCTDTEMIIHTNNIPNFEFVSITPNSLQAHDFIFTLPLEPTVANSPTDVPLGGASAIAVNGLVIFGPTEAPQTGYRDPYLDQILDYCNGHTAPGGIYHFHARPDCIYEDIDGQVGLVLAYAFDGHPILAPFICADTACNTVTELQSSWQDVNPTLSNAWERHAYVAGSGDLDECNGLTLADGSYVYFATDTFPYFMGCYRGTVTTNNLIR